MLATKQFGKLLMVFFMIAIAIGTASADINLGSRNVGGWCLNGHEQIWEHDAIKSIMVNGGVYGSSSVSSNYRLSNAHFTANNGGYFLLNGQNIGSSMSIEHWCDGINVNGNVWGRYDKTVTVMKSCSCDWTGWKSIGSSCGNCGTTQQYCDGCNLGSTRCVGDTSKKQTQACGLGGSQIRTCQSNGYWGSWGACTGQGVCQPGTKQTQACGTNVGVCTYGSQTKTCQSNYYWGSWGACTGGVQPSAEICDGKDNDCDGSTDEGGVCGPSLNIPNRNIAEDSGFNNNLVDLWSYASDPNTPDSGLGFAITSQSATSIVSCSLDSNRYIDCTTQTNRNGYSDVTVRVTDGTHTKTDTFRVTVTPVNDAPTASNVAVSTSEDTPVSVTLKGNDIDSTSLTYSLVSSPTHGTISGSGASRTYRPAANWFGVDTFTYRVNDGKANSNTATVTVTVSSVNDAPIVNIPDRTVAEDSGLTDNLVDLWTYTSDAETADSGLTYTITSQSTASIINCVMDSNRYIDCTTQTNRNGHSDVTVRVSDGVNVVTDTFRVTVTPVNDAPTVSDSSLTTTEDTPVSVPLSGNDVDGDTLVYTVISQPSNGVLTGNGNPITYTPNTDWYGVDTFTYRAYDGKTTSNTATVTITVSPVNDAPVMNIPDQTIMEDSGLNDNLVDLHAFTSDADNSVSSLTYNIVSQSVPQLANCVLDSNRYIDCTTYQDMYGNMTITVSVTDGTNTVSDTFTLNVQGVNDAPYVFLTHPDAQHHDFVVDHNVRIIANVTDPENDPMTYTITYGDGQQDSGSISGNQLLDNHTYTTPGNYTIRLSASDATNTTTDTVEIRVWEHSFNITDLKPYNDSGFSNVDYQFYRNESLYIKFDVVDKNLGNGQLHYVPNNINHVYMFHREHPSKIVNLTKFDNGNTILNGQPATPNGTYYFWMPNIPLGDEYLGWNIVFVFTHNTTDAGQKELEIEILNNPVQLSDIPNINFKDVNNDSSIDLDDYVYDVETPDNEITWSWIGNNIVQVILGLGNVVTFVAPANWIGSETIWFTADDNDGSTASDAVVVSSGVPDVNLITPQCNEDVYMNHTVLWSAVDYQNDTLQITLQYSSDAVNWITIAANETNDGTYFWDVSGIPQGLYWFRVLADDGQFVGEDISDCQFRIYDTPPSNVGLYIVADPVSGRAPLAVNFHAMITAGNAPFTYEWDLNNDGKVDATTNETSFVYGEEGVYTASLKVTDFDGDIGFTTVVITVEKEMETEPREIMKIDRYMVYGDTEQGDDHVKPGSDLIVNVDLNNIGRSDLRQVSVVAVVPELGLRMKDGPFRFDDGDAMFKKLVIPIPEDAQPGTYTVRLTIANDDFERTRHREFVVVE